MAISSNDIENIKDLTVKTSDIYAALQPHPDLNHFTYSRSYHDGRRLTLANNAEHIDCYFSEALYKKGNTEGEPTLYKNGFYLTNTLPQQEINSLMENRFNEHHGLFYILQHHRYCEFIFFAFDQFNPALNNFYLNHRQKITEAAWLFRRKAESLIGKAKQHRIVLPFNELAEQKEITNKYQTETNAKLASLTLAELKYAFELCKGGTDKEIAKRTFHSHRTLEKHLASVREKLGCGSRSNVVQYLHSSIQ